mmetsp:Transcript_24768/g.39795  ORF Transcript_24768/g.39795 Transcript_24768/m.39795 type:complete len:214 (-) Transcript_24768:68-709(-)
MMDRNSRSSMTPSPLLSNSCIMAASSASSTSSPISFATRRRLRTVILPDESSSNTLNALASSSSGFRAPIFCRIISRNSGYSMAPLLSLSYSCMMALTSSFLTANPRARMATLSSRTSMVPLLSTSNRLNASWSSPSSSGLNALGEGGFLRAADCANSPEFAAFRSDAIERTAPSSPQVLFCWLRTTLSLSRISCPSPSPLSSEFPAIAALLV